MNIARFEPWTFVDLLHRDLDRIAHKRGIASNDHSEVADWVPAVDIIEEEDRFVLRADVPGVKPEDIDVSMDGGILSVSGERHASAPGEDSGMQRIERVTGRFLRRFTLPETADADSIAAKCADGILEARGPPACRLGAGQSDAELAADLHDGELRQLEPAHRLRHPGLGHRLRTRGEAEQVDRDRERESDGWHRNPESIVAAH